MNSSPIATANVRHPRLLLDRLIGTGRTKAMVQNDRVRDPVHADENIVTIAVESFRSVVLTTSQSLYRVQVCGLRAARLLIEVRELRHRIIKARFSGRKFLVPEL